ncbi:transporter [Crenobacter sp. SG2305]|uniref:transporter n=1 Tax=Crenobacter oryzisoli TaxID=3056844 RepID=UPI0025AB246F|nr:transporter [Crenobacter sp. SG2305]MDN0082610.1 transporter [Crenobacter sp. SG2305]
MKRALSCHKLLFASAVLLLQAATARAQELEPRTYSASPIGTNFLVANYTYLTGDVLTDPSLPITDVQAHINLVALGYVRTFGIAGHSASLGFGLPFASGDMSGNVIDAPREVHRAGIGDLRLRFAFNLIGDPALTPEEFAKRTPRTSLGASLTMTAPTGQYVPSRLINVGTNRWSFKPEIGISQPIGQWFAEASAGVWFFTDNNDFFGGNRRSQDPLAVLQLHTGYNFRPGLWVAGDLGYDTGGRTQLNGIPNQDRRANVRYGMTFATPIADGWSAKLAMSNGFVTRAGGDYKAILLTLQYRWFDR